jgi:hypothetical protein
MAMGSFISSDTAQLAAAKAKLSIQRSRFAALDDDHLNKASERMHLYTLIVHVEDLEARDGESPTPDAQCDCRDDHRHETCPTDSDGR